MLASTMGLGLHANYLAMIEKKNLRRALRSEGEHAAWRRNCWPRIPMSTTPISRQGIENYLLSQKAAGCAGFCVWAARETDQQVGIKKTGITAEKGHYFMPYARLLLAIQELRDNNREGAKQKLTWLAKEYPATICIAKNSKGS